MTRLGKHLTEEALADLLAGAGAPETHAHLRACEACRHEAEELGAALGGLRYEGLAWAEARAESHPKPWAGVLVPRSKGTLLDFPSAFPRSARAAAAILLACTAVGGMLRLSDHSTQLHEHAPGTLSEDNRLLLSIDEELSAQEPSPREVYATGTSAARSAREVSGSGDAVGSVRE